MEVALGLFAGVGLSAAAGFRLFVPFLIMSLASLTGNLELAPGFEWIGTYPALIAFGFATLLEIVAYFIPWFDNLLVTIAVPVSIIAGSLMMGSVLTDFSPLIKWSLSIIAGGGLAGSIQSATSILRAGSTYTTGGLANPVISTTEAGISVSLSALAIFLPLLAFILIIVFIFWIIKKFGKRFLLHRKI